MTQRSRIDQVRSQCLRYSRLKDRQGYDPCALTLRKWDEDQWVTHIYNIAQDGFSHGHYFSTYEEAEQNFLARLQSW